MLKKLLCNIYTVLRQAISFDTAKKMEFFIYRKILNRADNLHCYYMNHAGRDKMEYCVFRYGLPGISLFSTGIEFLFKAEYVSRRGIVPVLDLEYNHVFEKGNMGESNAWELVFSQKVSTETVKNRKNVFVEMVGEPYEFDWHMCKKINNNVLKHRIYTKEADWKNYYSMVNKYVKKWWVIRPEIESFCDKFVQERFPDESVTLGVLLREDFSQEMNSRLGEENARIHSYHPLNPNVDEIIPIVRSKLDEWGCDKIFISTLYEESLGLFLKEFGEDTIESVDRFRHKMDVENDPNRVDRSGMSDEQRYKEYQEKKNFYDNEIITYAYEMIILSKCDYLVTATSSGSAAVLAMNGGQFKDICVLENRQRARGY